MLLISSHQRLPHLLSVFIFFLTVIAIVAITIVVCTEVVTGSHFTLHNDTPPQHIQTRIYLFTFCGYFQVIADKLSAVLAITGEFKGIRKCDNFNNSWFKIKLNENELLLSGLFAHIFFFFLTYIYYLQVSVNAGNNLHFGNTFESNSKAWQNYLLASFWLPSNWWNGPHGSMHWKQHFPSETAKTAFCVKRTR